MQNHWVELAWMVAVAAAGYAVSRLALRRKLSNAATELARLQQQLDVATETIRSMEARLAQHGFASIGNSLAEQTMEAESSGGDAVLETISAETQAAIAAAVMAFVGGNVRIRSARQLAAHGATSPWTQQGRVVVQASHNLRTRR